MNRGSLGDGDADRLTLLRTALDGWPLPLASEVNPLADQATRRQRSWFTRYALADVGDPGDPLIVLQAPRVAALAYPRADLAALSLAADWTAWFFHFDDYFDEGVLGATEHGARQTVNFIRDAFDHRPGGGASLGDKPLHRTREAFADLMARTLDVMTDWQSRMFVFHLESYFEALATEAVNREHHAIPDVSSYCAAVVPLVGSVLSVDGRCR
jgi:Terpene synthase family 2, C-terminal metal binding